MGKKVDEVKIMSKKYVWYACYGSNLCKERFLLYIKGGTCRFNGKYYNGCTDKSEPVKDRPIKIPHRLYFGNKSYSWHGGGVAFIDPRKDEKEKTLGRMYLITEEQFTQIHEQEGPGSKWYGKILELGEAEGHKIMTFTSDEIRPANLPHEQYIEVISTGLEEIYPEMDEKTIKKYLHNSI